MGRVNMTKGLSASEIDLVSGGNGEPETPDGGIWDWLKGLGGGGGGGQQPPPPPGSTGTAS